MSTTVGKIAAICLAVATFFVAGCSRSDPAAEQARIDAEVATRLDAAKHLLYNGSIDQAVSALEVLDADHPNRPGVIEQLAFAYAEVPDPAMAAFYFDQAYTLTPSRTDLALFAAQAHTQMKDWPAAAMAYQHYLEGEPMDAGAWKQLAQAQRNAGKLQPSLEAWLRAFKTEKSKPTVTEAVELGSLYYQLGNQAQAGDWWNYALKLPDQDGAHAQARLGLLRLALAREHWAQAEELVANLDAQSPALIDNSDLAGVRRQLADLRAATSGIKPPAASGSIATTGTGSSASAVTPSGTATTGSAATTGTTTAATSSSATGTATTNVADLPDSGGSKLVDPADVAPAGQDTVTGPAGVPQEHVISASWGDAGDGTPTDSTEVAVTEDNTTVAPTPLADGQTPAADTEPEMPAPKNEYERGVIAYQEGNFPAAIRHFQMSLAIENSQNALTFYDLSRAYYAIGQWQQAELFASEAMRLQPKNIQYRAQYLRAIQKSQSRQRLMEELVAAYELFPDSPDIALALARGYDKIEQNPRNARYMYEQFLELAPPDHPKRAEIEELLVYYP
ncbi:MAG: tetratricopeptide repeat protein [Verrucomicrobiota bacterium JB024]|nr:tetratricopeptide repeat protein [Verrucomicrobiota bacterium JB024]